MALGVILAPYGKLPDGQMPSTVLLSFGGDGTYMQPNYDRMYNMRGEPALYHDTPLGAPAKVSWIDRLRAKFASRAARAGRAMDGIPTDAELSTHYGFTFPHSGWVASADGTQWPSAWVPPNGYRQGGYPLPNSTLSGFGIGPVVSPPPPPQTELPPVSLPPTIMPPAPGPAVDPNSPASVMDVMAALQAHNDRIFALQVVSATAVAVSALITVFRTIKLIRAERGTSE